MKSEPIEHGAVKGFMASLVAFNISGESQALVWEFIASARNDAREYDVLSLDAAILAPRFFARLAGWGVVPSHRHWVGSTVDGQAGAVIIGLPVQR